MTGTCRKAAAETAAGVAIYGSTVLQDNFRIAHHRALNRLRNKVANLTGAAAQEWLPLKA